MIIDEFEKSALQSNTREGYLVVANSPLTGMESVLGGAKRAISGVKKSRDTASGAGASEQSVESVLNEDEKVFSSGSVETTPPAFDLKGGNVSAGGVSVIQDADLLNLMSGPDGNNPVKSYLEDCLGCNLRLKFDWQIKPLNLMLPIGNMLDTINASIDLFLSQLDPFKSLGSLCDLLNQLKGFCIPDLIALLLSLKLLLKKQLSAAFQIKLDWTVLLGPILKVIIDAIASLLENILAILLAPIDCVLGVLRTAEELERAGRGFAGALATTPNPSNPVSDPIRDTSASTKKNEPLFAGSGFTARDVEWEAGVKEDKVPNPGRLKTSDRLFNGPQVGAEASGELEASGSFTIPTGFILNNNTTTLDALKDPAWVNASFMQKLIVPVQEARQFIVDTVGNILKALYSLEQLVSGGLGLNLDILSIMTFITDMISLVMMIINMIQANKGVKDWCSFLEENPKLLEQHLHDRFGPVRVEVRDVDDHRELALSLGPQIVGTIQTCTSARTSFDQQLLQQWISDLKA
jgi:hypothetical protein